MNWRWLAIPGALAAGLTVWGTLGFPTIATGMDIKRLDRKQAETAVDTYRNKLRFYMFLQEPEDPVQRQFLREELESARRQLEAAEERKIGCCPN